MGWCREHCPLLCSSPKVEFGSCVHEELLKVLKGVKLHQSFTDDTNGKI